MKQLTILCSPELSPQVVALLEGHGLDGFIEIGEVTGNRFESRDPLSRTVTWEGVMLQAHVAEDRVVDDLARGLLKLRKECGTRPCLRLFLSPVEEIL